MRKVHEGIGRRVWLLIACMLMAGQAAAAQVGDRTLSDVSGASVRVPTLPAHIADGWYAHNAILIMLGGDRQLTDTVASQNKFPLMYRVSPYMKHAQSANGNQFDRERLLAHHVDLVFDPQEGANAASYRSVGLPVALVGFDSYPGLEKSVRVTAQALNTDMARARSAAFLHYLHDLEKQVRQRVEGLPVAALPRVVHIVSLNPLRVDGSDTIIDAWIHLAGGINAAAQGGIRGNMKEATLESLIAWHPNVIIIGAGAMPDESAEQSAIFARLTKEEGVRVVPNPAGVFPWDRYGPESALQILWAATVLHPDRFTDVDMVARTEQFYRDFFGYVLTERQARAVLRGDPNAAAQETER
ncbi:hypothetical protein [Robbsia sp. KACC 23696]|uniref:ABC transporter substrate-binding protein n=1 Tax=Robbsia sp. KACC 23696 TaxID=3149231 RepID=UPI00325ABE3C